MPFGVKKSNIWPMNPKPQAFSANGKVLLTAEYLVLLGAKALCLPLRNKGQELIVSLHETPAVKWLSYENGSLWFEAEFNPSLEVISSSDMKLAENLKDILHEIQKLKPDINWEHLKFKTDLNFNRHYGLGSSSTLISLLSQWSETDPYLILENTFGGSGYDLACAVSESPLLYTRGETPETIDWEPKFKDQLYFVYLNKKQSSQNEVKKFLASNNSYHHECQIISNISESIIEAKTISDFEMLIKLHEETMTSLLQRPRIKEEMFSDFDGEIKSLGAWGGDFILVTSQNSPYEYFKSKGHNVIFTWDEFIYE